MREEIQAFINYMEEEKQRVKKITTLSISEGSWLKSGRISWRKTESQTAVKLTQDGVEFLSPFSGKRGKGGIDGLKVPGVRKVIFWLDA